jgi:hypothetical protein
MKALAIFGFFILVHFSFFFILSAIGLLWCDTYTEIIRAPQWFMMYTMFIGIWASLFATREVYEDMYDVL